MYKLVACDLDETLLTSDSKISKENVEAIHKAKILGVKFVLATGRGYEDVQNILKEIDLHDKEDEYVISFNGGSVTENKDNKLLYYQGISFEFADYLYRKGLEYDVCIHVYTKDDVFVYNIDEDEREHLEKRIEFSEISDDNLNFLRGTDIVKIVYMNTDVPYLNSIEKDLKSDTQNGDISYSSNRYLEINHNGVTKGEGLKFLTNYLGIDMRDTIAIGDNFNDQSMLDIAGFSVGVQNMVPELKENVDYITESTHDEHAVANVINKFILKCNNISITQNK